MSNLDLEKWWPPRSGAGSWPLAAMAPSSHRSLAVKEQ
jgi:hypothetical protein